MSALIADRSTIRRDGVDYSFPVKTAVKIYTGAIVVIETATGYAKPGVSASGLIAVGIAQETIDNTSGSSGAVSVKVKQGVFALDNPASLTATSIGVLAYVVDDHSVNATATSQSIAGRIVDVSSEGLFVDFNQKA